LPLTFLFQSWLLAKIPSLSSLKECGNNVLHKHCSKTFAGIFGTMQVIYRHYYDRRWMKYIDFFMFFRR
jgi:hypothetical protein